MAKPLPADEFFIFTVSKRTSVDVHTIFCTRVIERATGTILSSSVLYNSPLAFMGTYSHAARITLQLFAEWV